MNELDVGNEIKDCRKSKGISQKELAEKTGLAEITIRQYEAGKRNPKIENLQKIAKALDSEIHYSNDSLELREVDKRFLEVGQNIKEIRRYRGHTQKGVAEKMNIATGTLQQWESGKREPSFTSLYALADLLEVDIVDFFWGREE